MKARTALMATQKRRVSIPELKKVEELAGAAAPTAAAAAPAASPAVEGGAGLKRVSSPIEAPSRLPVWKAALPMVMAETTRTAVRIFAVGLLKCVRSASPSPLREMMPSRAAISCRMIVAATEKTIPQSNA